VQYFDYDFPRFALFFFFTFSTEKLETMLVNGQGERLLGKTSSDPDVRDFLEQVPGFLVSDHLVFFALPSAHTSARPACCLLPQSVLS
jgi:hypothetical protein